MNAIAPRRKGWCPGALRPMETGDGLIARVRAPRGRLSLDQAAAVAESALRCGNGAIGLSARGNLHLRGLSERSLPDLHRRLGDAGLIDADPEVERLRNIVVSPLDDVDPDALLDLGPSAGRAGDAARRGRGTAPVAGEVQLRPRRARAPAARRRRRGHSLRSVRRRGARGLSRRRRRARRGLRARRDRRNRGATRARFRSPCRSARRVAAADARARRAYRGQGRVRRGVARSRAARAFAAARVAQRPPRRARNSAPRSLSARRRRLARSRPADF